MRNTNLEPKMVQVESRLLLIPVIFILLRMWGTIQFFFSLAVADSVDNGCVPKSTHIAFYVLGILQVQEKAQFTIR
jgi:formaldehyde-activating enzyme involved in methanogenesis